MRTRDPAQAVLGCECKVFSGIKVHKMSLILEQIHHCPKSGILEMFKPGVFDFSWPEPGMLEGKSAFSSSPLC